MTGPRIKFVTSARPEDGRGHSVRVVTLSEAVIRQAGIASVTYLAGGPTPREARRFRTSGVDVGTLDGHADLWVLDLPDPDQVADRMPPGRTVVFDDRETFHGRAALIVQPSLPTWGGSARADRVLAGYHWAPIGAAWREVRPRDVESAGPARVVVCFGGSDPADVTSRLGSVLARDPRWSATLVVGHGYVGRAMGSEVLRDPADLPARVAAAEIAVIGAGTMKFEVAHLGRPAVLVAAADDQLGVGPAFAATGAARWLGDGRTIDPEQVRTAVAEVLGDRAARAAMSATARRVVDGRGGDRLAIELVRLACMPSGRHEARGGAER